MKLFWVIEINWIGTRKQRIIKLAKTSRIEAIKMCRSEYDIGLKEAKERVDKWTGYKLRYTPF